MPLFVSLDDGYHHQTGGGGNRGSSNDHFIPEKFSDLFKDLAVPAGLFMMPALFQPRNYAFEVPEVDAEVDAAKYHKNNTDTDTESETDTESDDEYHKTKMVPNDIFDTLLSLVTPSERIQHDVKSRRRRQSGGKDKKRQNNTKRAKT